VYEWSKYNLKGNRENQPIMDLNDSVLATNNGSWDLPPKGKIIWTTEQAKKRDEIIANFAYEAQGTWGFKDPRTLFTLPFWKEGLGKIKFVASFRHPALVAKSLCKRNNMPIKTGLALWTTYNQRLLSYLDEDECLIISFNLPISNYLSCIKCLSEHLGIRKPSCNDNNLFRDESLVNQQLEESDVQLVPDSAIKLYDKLNQHFMSQSITSCYTNPS